MLQDRDPLLGSENQVVAHLFPVVWLRTGQQVGEWFGDLSHSQTDPPGQFAYMDPAGRGIVEAALVAGSPLRGDESVFLIEAHG